METSGLKGLPYEKLQFLGEGGYGCVFKVRYTHTGEEYALKRIKKHKVASPKDREKIDREIQLMKLIDHPNIIKLIDHFETEKQINLILELAQGNLHDKLQLQGSFQQHRVVQYVKELVSALQYLHSRPSPIVHRDIKPQNLVVSSDGTLKLIDFGAANAISQKGVRSTYAGTEIYMAPEMVNNDPYTTSLDLWNVGLIIYEFLTGSECFKKVVQKLHSKGRTGQIQISFPAYFPVLARDVVKRLLKEDPEQRMTLQELKDHVWLNIGTETPLVLKSRFDIQRSRKFQDVKTTIQKLKEDLYSKKKEEEEIVLIKEKIAERRKQGQLMALAEPQQDYLGLREQLLELRLQMRGNHRQLQERHQQVMAHKAKHTIQEDRNVRQTREYEAKIETLKVQPVKRYIQLRNQLKLATNCINQLTAKAKSLPQSIISDFQYIREVRKPTPKQDCNLDLVKLTVKTLTAKHKALTCKRDCLIRTHRPLQVQETGSSAPTP